MRSVLVLAGAAAASVIALSTANAQDCVDGYRTLGNGVIALFDEPMAFAASPGQALPEEPMFTGSIASAAPLPPDYREQPAVEGSFTGEPLVTGSIGAPAGLPPDYRENNVAAAEAGIEQPVIAMQAEGPWACQPGQYWIVAGEGRDTPIMCR